MSALSYADVRDFVYGRAGECDINPSEIEIHMLSVLEDFKNRIGSDVSQFTKANLSVVSGDSTYAVPATLDRISSIENADGCELAIENIPCPACRIYQPPTGKPLSWHMDLDTIVIHPVPNGSFTLTVRGTKARERYLYDVDENNYKTWRIVDLPEGLHYAYAQAVLGQAIVAEDVARGQYWMSMAHEQLANWKNSRDRSLTKGASRHLKVNRFTHSRWTWGYDGDREGYRARINPVEG